MASSNTGQQEMRVWSVQSAKPAGLQFREAMAFRLMNDFPPTGISPTVISVIWGLEFVTSNAKVFLDHIMV